MVDEHQFGWIRRITVVLARHKSIVYLMYLAIIWFAVFALSSSPPTYEVSSIVSMEPGPLADDRSVRLAEQSQPEQLARPQIALLESEDVIRHTISLIGADKLYPNNSSGSSKETGLFDAWPDALARYAELARQIFERRRLQPALSADDRAYLAVRATLDVRPEPQTNLIRVAFRHLSPRIAVDFTNKLIQSFIERYFQLYGNITAITFLKEQNRRSDEEIERSAGALAEYSKKFQIFRADEQRRLLLQQRSNLALALVGTRGALAEKEGQLAVIPGLLSQMKPINRLPQITGLLPGNAKAAPGKNDGSDNIANLSTDPPLLLVRVYQDTVASIVKFRTDAAGLRALEAHQLASLKQLDSDLSALASKEAEFDRLTDNVSRARANSQLLSKKALEEEFSQDLNARRLSSLQVIQKATVPMKAIWPKPALLLALGLLLSFFPLVLGFILRHARRNAGLLHALSGVR